jgi:hypothetical protein
MSGELEKGLVSMLSGVASGRVYPRTPQNATRPFLRFTRIGTMRRQSLTGPVGVTEATVQVDCMADTYAEAKDTADAVRAILHGYRGAWGTLTARLVHLESENDFYEQDGDKLTHWVSQRYAVHTNMS